MMLFVTIYFVLFSILKILMLAKLILGVECFGVRCFVLVGGVRDAELCGLLSFIGGMFAWSLDGSIVSR